MNIFFINIGGRKMKKDLLQIELETQFKWFHAHPELSYQEYETTSRLKKLLKEHDIEILDLPLDTGLVAIIRENILDQ